MSQQNCLSSLASFILEHRYFRSHCALSLLDTIIIGTGRLVSVFFCKEQNMIALFLPAKVLELSGLEISRSLFLSPKAYRPQECIPDLDAQRIQDQVVTQDLEGDSTDVATTGRVPESVSTGVRISGDCFQP